LNLQEFDDWSSRLSHVAGTLIREENENRMQWRKNLHKHFIRSLFACIAPTDDASDMVPEYACVRPPPFDVDLPAISVENLRLLRSAAPALGRI
jgi:hypothetical protein